MKTHILQNLYQDLFSHFGPQKWWPGDSPFEVCLGAILTQNTAWTNVEKAISNIKSANVLNFEALLDLNMMQLAELIKPAGYFNIKAKRIKAFLHAVQENYGSFEGLHEVPQRHLREFLLGISGIGPETADSMMLYAFGHAEFVVDAYTKRILIRHRLMDVDADYYRIKEYFENHLESDSQVFNEYHALIVAVAKSNCRKTKPDCEHCPLREFNGGFYLE